jgi:hypothetical protein
MYVDDEKLLQIIFKQLVDEKKPVEVIVGEFLPYLNQRVDIDPLKPLYLKVRDNATTPWMSSKELEDYYDDIYQLFGVESVSDSHSLLIKKMVKELRIPVEKPMDKKE